MYEINVKSVVVCGALPHLMCSTIIRSECMAFKLCGHKRDTLKPQIYSNTLHFTHGQGHCFLLKANHNYHIYNCAPWLKYCTQVSLLWLILCTIITLKVIGFKHILYTFIQFREHFYSPSPFYTVRKVLADFAVHCQNSVGGFRSYKVYM